MQPGSRSPDTSCLFPSDLPAMPPVEGGMTLVAAVLAGRAPLT